MKVTVDKARKVVVIELSTDGYIDSYEQKDKKTKAVKLDANGKPKKTYICDRIGSQFGGQAIPELGAGYFVSAGVTYNPHAGATVQSSGERQPLPK